MSRGRSTRCDEHNARPLSRQGIYLPGRNWAPVAFQCLAETSAGDCRSHWLIPNLGVIWRCWRTIQTSLKPGLCAKRKLSPEVPEIYAVIRDKRFYIADHKRSFFFQLQLTDLSYCKRSNFGNGEGSNWTREESRMYLEQQHKNLIRPFLN